MSRAPRPAFVAKLARFAAALAAACLVAGCGSSANSTAGPQTPATTPASSATSPTGGSGGAGSAATHPSPAKIATCKATVEARAGLSASTKAALLEICSKAATENPIQLRATAAEVCTDLVNSSAIPAGTEKDQALAACKAA